MKISSLKGKRQKISDKEILELASLGKKLEHHYYFPQDSEWAIEKGKVYIVQTRAVTTTDKKESKNENAVMDEKNAILKGDPASPGIALPERSGTKKIHHQVIFRVLFLAKGINLVTGSLTQDAIMLLHQENCTITCLPSTSNIRDAKGFETQSLEVLFQKHL